MIVSDSYSNENKRYLPSLKVPCHKTPIHHELRWYESRPWTTHEVRRGRTQLKSWSYEKRRPKHDAPASSAQNIKILTLTPKRKQCVKVKWMGTPGSNKSIFGILLLTSQLFTDLSQGQLRVWSIFPTLRTVGNPFKVDITKWCSSDAWSSVIKIFINVHIEKWVQVYEIFIWMQRSKRLDNWRILQPLL